MATNKKITELTELVEADLADDDVLPIVDISAGQTFKVRKSTLASALAGVASLAATTPVAVNQATGSVTVSLNTVPIASGGTGATTASAARTALGAMEDPLTTRGDIIRRGASATERLALGSSGTVLKSDGTDIAYGSVATSELTGNIDLTSQVTGTLPLANGGTNATTASGARTSLGAAASGANTDITSLAADIVISGSTSGDALRITQTGAGNALVVEDDTNPDSTPFVVDATGKVGVGSSSPDRLLDVEAASGDAYIRFRALGTGGGEDTIFENLVSDNTRNNYIFFGDLDDLNIGMIRYSHSSDFMSFTTNAAEHMRIESDGGVKVFNAAYNPITTDNDLSFDQAASNNFKCTPSGSGTLTFTNHTDGQSGNILLINTGGHAISLAATTKGDANLASTISTAGTYWLSYYDDGTNAYVVTSTAFA